MVPCLAMLGCTSARAMSLSSTHVATFYAAALLAVLSRRDAKAAVAVRGSLSNLQSPTLSKAFAAIIHCFHLSAST